MRSTLYYLRNHSSNFFGSQIFAWNSQRNIETYPYKVIKIRHFRNQTYEATLFTSVQLSTNAYKESSSKGFSILAGYIFGGNEENRKSQ
jgi:hypothetical protein